jgi:hypothetical protein
MGLPVAAQDRPWAYQFCYCPLFFKVDILWMRAGPKPGDPPKQND